VIDSALLLLLIVSVLLLMHLRLCWRLDEAEKNAWKQTNLHETIIARLEYSQAFDRRRLDALENALSILHDAFADAPEDPFLSEMEEDYDDEDL
jgi:hypothetical protein